MNPDDVLADGARLLDAMNQTDFARAQARIAAAPIALTDHDFVVLHNYGGEGEASRAYEARRLAQLEVVRQCGGSQQSAPLQTKAITPRKAPPETMEEFVHRFGLKGAGYALQELQDLFTNALLNHKEKLDALTQQNKTLSDRVLELEARAAAVDHETR